MRIYEIIQRFSLNEIAGCDAFLMKKELEKAGHECSIYALQMSAEDAYSGRIRRIESLPEISCDDAVIYIHKDGSLLCDTVTELPGKKLLVYHDPVRPQQKTLAVQGYEELRAQYLSTLKLKDAFDGAMVFSREGRRDLEAMGFKCPTVQRQLMLSEEDFMKERGGAVPDYYREEGITNIIYCGRISPDDRIDKVIAAYAVYRRYFNRKSRLLLVSSGYCSAEYCRRLTRYADMMELEEVCFTKALSVKERRAYIDMADVLICTGSEDIRESAAEAAFMGKAAAAEKCPANAGLLGEDTLIQDLDPHITAVFIDRVVSDPSFREMAAGSQRAAVRRLCGENAGAAFMSQTEELLRKLVHNSEKDRNSKSEIRA